MIYYPSVPSCARALVLLERNIGESGANYEREKGKWGEEWKKDSLLLETQNLYHLARVPEVSFQ